MITIMPSPEEEQQKNSFREEVHFGEENEWNLNFGNWVDSKYKSFLNTDFYTLYYNC